MNYKLEYGMHNVSYVAASIFIDQFIINWPLMSSFLVLCEMMDTKGDLLKSVEVMQEEIMPQMQTSWKINPAFQTITFGVIPQQYRPLFEGLTDLIWSIALCYTKNGCKDTPSHPLPNDDAVPAAVIKT